MRSYRGKTNDSEWVEGFHFQAYNDIGQEARLVDYIIAEHPFVLKAENMASEGRLAVVDFVEVIPESVGQDTGLKDKNGKAIFGPLEGTKGGDIFSYEGFEGKFLVKWGHWGWTFEGTIPEEDRHASRWPPITMPSGNFEYIEVIGNATDNPELLEKK